MATDAAEHARALYTRAQDEIASLREQLHSLRFSNRRLEEDSHSIRRSPENTRQVVSLL